MELLGSALVAAAAAGLHADLAGAAAAMTGPGRAITPDRARLEAYRRDDQVFLAMHEQRRALDRIAATPAVERALPGRGADLRGAG